MRNTFNSILDVAADMGSSYNGNPQQMDQITVGCLIASYSGSPNGSLKLQVSDDGVIWADLASTATAITTAGTTSWNLWPIGYEYLRIVYTKSSGSGLLSTTFRGKGA